MSMRSCHAKIAVRPASRLHCTTKRSLRISMGGGFPERPQRHAPHVGMRPDMAAIVVLRPLVLPWLRRLWARSCTSSLRVIPAVQKPDTMRLLLSVCRGLYHGIPSRFLPARAGRPGVVVPDALWAVAIGACCSSPNATQAAAAPVQALHKAQALSGSHP